MGAHPSWESVHFRVLQFRAPFLTVEKVPPWLTSSPFLPWQVFFTPVDVTKVPTALPPLPPLPIEGAVVTDTATL